MQANLNYDEYLHGREGRKVEGEKKKTVQNVVKLPNGIPIHQKKCVNSTGKSQILKRKRRNNVQKLNIQHCRHAFKEYMCEI